MNYKLVRGSHSIACDQVFLIPTIYVIFKFSCDIASTNIQPRLGLTSARNRSIAKPLKQLMTACCTSNPMASSALTVERRSPGRRAQNIWMLSAWPSFFLTSTWACEYKLNHQLIIQNAEIVRTSCDGLPFGVYRSENYVWIHCDEEHIKK